MELQAETPSEGAGGGHVSDWQGLKAGYSTYTYISTYIPSRKRIIYTPTHTYV